MDGRLGRFGALIRDLVAFELLVGSFLADAESTSSTRHCVFYGSDGELVEFHLQLLHRRLLTWHVLGLWLRVVVLNQALGGDYYGLDHAIFEHLVPRCLLEACVHLSGLGRKELLPKFEVLLEAVLFGCVFRLCLQLVHLFELTLCIFYTHSLVTDDFVQDLEVLFLCHLPEGAYEPLELGLVLHS